ncbi:MAG: hypothetical protein ACI9KE_003525 [Polyangiales bacterium]|jgi:hypothetical protein
MVGFDVARGDVKSDKKPRFPRIAASLSPLFAVGGVLLFARELQLGRLFGEPVQATLSITTLAVALGAASLLALLVRGRRVGGPVPWTLLALVATIPAATGALLPGADDSLYATGLWCSAWLCGALGWVAVIEVFATKTLQNKNIVAIIPAALALIATVLCALTSLALVPFALLAWALPASHFGRPGDAKAESALLCAPLFVGAALWLGRCAMVRAGVVTVPNALALAACACIVLDVFVGLWVVRPRALGAALPLVIVLGAWSIFEGARSEAPSAPLEIEAPLPADDGQGLRIPYAPREE